MKGSLGMVKAKLFAGASMQQTFCNQHSPFPEPWFRPHPPIASFPRCHPFSPAPNPGSAQFLDVGRVPWAVLASLLRSITGCKSLALCPHPDTSQPGTEPPAAHASGSPEAWAAPGKQWMKRPAAAGRLT